MLLKVTFARYFYCVIKNTYKHYKLLMIELKHIK